MIRVTIEMIPLGNETAKYPLGVIEISNEGRDGEGRHDRCKYDVEVKHSEAGGPPLKYRRITHERREGYFALLVYAFVKLWNSGVEDDAKKEARER